MSRLRTCAEIDAVRGLRVTPNANSRYRALLESKWSYRRWTLGLLAYVAPTFLLGLVWHLLLFKGYYDELAVYRADIVIPFGLISMVIQGSVYSFAYGRLLAGNDILQGALKFALIAGLLAWSYLVLTVAAKHWMSSVAGYVVIETAFTVVQFAVTGPLIASVYRNAR